MKKKGSFGRPAIFFVVWAVVLLIAFLANRGSDVGQLQKLLGNLGGGPLAGAGIVDSVFGAIAALLIVVAWFGLGNFVASLIKTAKSEHHSHLLELAMKTAVGAAMWSSIWFFLGLAGAYSGIVAIAFTIIGLVFAALGFRRNLEAKTESKIEDPFGFDKVLLALIAVPVGLAFVASLAPPTAKDTLLYHFALPKAFIEQGGNAFIEGNIASYLALGTEMHTVWAMLVGGLISERAAEAAAGATIFMFLPLLLLAVYGWTRELGGSRSWSLIAVLIVATVPTVYYVASSGYIDIALALFVTVAVYSLSRWWQSQQKGWLVLIAIFLGAALSAKLTAFFVFAAFALIILLRARKAMDAAGIIGRGFAALILAVVIASPWYLRTWQATGSPFFPFYMGIWEGKAVGWDVERSNLFQAMNTQYGGADKNALDYLLAPWNLSVAAQPEQPKFFDGVLGVAFLFGLPILVWALWKFELSTEVKIGLGVAAIVFLFWLFSSQQLRYLLPILPVLAMAIAISAETISKRLLGLRAVLRISLVVSAAAGILVSAAWFLQKAPIRVALGGETREQYLTRNLDYYPYYQTLNTETAADAKVWLINMRHDTYNLEQPVFSDYMFEDWTLRKMVWESRSSQELKTKTAALGIKYVLTRHDFLLDFDRSTLVDDKRPKAENEAKLKIAKDFILDAANTVRADGKFSLVKVF